MDELSTIDSVVLDLISNSRGRGYAIGLKTLEAETGLSQRVIRDSIKRLIEDYGYPIGSSSDADNGGYFIITTEGERTHAMKQLISRIESLTRRMSSLSKAPLVLQGAA